MTELLIRLFANPPTRGAIGKMAGVVGIVCNLMLSAAKIVVGAIAGSVAMMADGVNNLTDAAGSIVTLIGFKVAGKPADEAHPYGHGRAEYLAGLGVAVIIVVIGIELGRGAIEKIIAPKPVEFGAASAAVLVAAIAVKLWMSGMYRKLAKRIDSQALKAQSADSRNDCIATAAVLIAGIVESVWGIAVDGVMGLLVAAFIVYSGWKLAKETISPLLGENCDKQLRGRIVEYISNESGVIGYHDLMVHDYGPERRYASVHIEMDAREDVLECHERIDGMERECLARYGVHLVIHYDPVIVDDPKLDELRERVSAILSGYDERLKLHDFRVVQGRRHQNVIFDLPLPYELEHRRSEILLKLEQELAGGEVEYHFHVTFDSVAFN